MTSFLIKASWILSEIESCMKLLLEDNIGTRIRKKYFITVVL